MFRLRGKRDRECQVCKKRLPVKSFPRRPNGIGRYDVCRACIDDSMRAAEAKRREAEAKQREKQARRRKQQEEADAARRAAAERERAEEAERQRQKADADRQNLQATLEELDSAVEEFITAGHDASVVWNLVPAEQREALRRSLFES